MNPADCVAHLSRQLARHGLGTVEVHLATREAAIRPYASDQERVERLSFVHAARVAAWLASLRVGEVTPYDLARRIDRVRAVQGRRPARRMPAAEPVAPAPAPAVQPQPAPSLFGRARRALNALLPR